MKKSLHEKISDVLREAHRSLAVHEFDSVMISMPVDHLSGGRVVDGRFYVGCSEQTLGRQLRKMRELNLVTSRTRDGKKFKEYQLVRIEKQFDFSFPGYMKFDVPVGVEKK